MYGRVAIANKGHVTLADGPLASADVSTAAARGRALQASYVLYGAIDNPSLASNLAVSIVSVEDGSALWSKTYPVAGADPVKIAEEVGSKVPPFEKD